MIRSLILPALTATLTLMALWDAAAPAQPMATTLVVPDLNVDEELRAGCASLIDIALSGGQDASWAISELERATMAPWATEALRVQAKGGLARIAELRLAVAAR